MQHQIKQQQMQKVKIKFSRKRLRIISNRQNNMINKISNNHEIFLEIFKQLKEILQYNYLIRFHKFRNLQKDENYKDYINLILEIQLLIDQAKKQQSQFNLFDQTIQLYQKHVQIIKQIQSNIQSKTTDQTNKSEQLIKSQYQNLQNIINDYENNFENNSKQFKKFCNIYQLENDLIIIKKKIKIQNQKIQNNSIYKKRNLKKKQLIQIRNQR
ncbi:unnamed protein product [Paramecium primaurelia]|uniref:PRD domain-containing protein n=1 Tax=Paramecium primaurelia TaxID=5886 RepID=A0A8S1MQN0_PARPR|nr:unnamed protein product [Paramecium primaurelia]